MRKIVPCSTMKYEEVVRDRKEKRTLTFSIPLDVLPKYGREELRNWWINSFDRAVVNWNTDTIDLEFTKTIALPIWMDDEDEYCVVVYEDDVPKTAPPYLLKILNEGAEYQDVSNCVTLEEVCLRSGLTYLQTELYMREDWTSNEDIDDFIYNYYD